MDAVWGTVCRALCTVLLRRHDERWGRLRCPTMWMPCGCVCRVPVMMKDGIFTLSRCFVNISYSALNS